MPLVESGQIVEDRYVRVADDAPVPDRVPVIVSAKRFLAEADALIRRDGSLGVSWPNDRRVAELEPWLGHLALVALNFPKFRDGRAYSQARLLRETYGFRGTLRATGDVLRDQFHFLVRAGFDSFEVKKPADARVFAEVVGRYSIYYQPGADGRAAGSVAEPRQGSEDLRACLSCRVWRASSPYRRRTAMVSLVP
jgi:uncharacterized protein (DUF934 family)